MRAAWICLPAAILSSLLGALLTVSEARAELLRSYEWGKAVTVPLSDGRTVTGAYRGSFGAWAEPAGYPGRFAAWRDSLQETFAPALGESIVVCLASGDTLLAEFRGLGPRTLLVGTSDSCRLKVLLLDQTTDLRLLHGEVSAVPWPETRNLWGGGPVLDFILLQDFEGIFAVPIERAAAGQWTPAKHATGSGSSGKVLAILAVVGLVALIVGGISSKGGKKSGGTLEIPNCWVPDGPCE